jgi:hypothetical protein
MMQRIGLWLSVVLLVLGLWLLAFTPANPQDFIALVAVVVAGLAWFQSYRSANAATLSADAATKSADASTISAAIAESDEERSKYGWKITLHPDGDHYVLRNAGTLAAHDVKFKNGDELPRARFLVHDGDEGPSIQPREAKAFHAISTWSSPSIELVIDWQPDGESQRRTFNEALPPMSNAAFEDHVKEQKESNAAEALARERAMAETRRLLIELAAAWGDYQADPSVGNKMRVQGLVGALPTHLAKQIGYAVDVPRCFWGPGQWPLEVFVQTPADKELVRENAPMIELIWNLWQVQLPATVDADLSQSPPYWHRIEHAVNGYVQLVRIRESGKHVPIEGPRDRKQREDAQKMFKQFLPPGQNPQTPGIPGRPDQGAQ